MAIWLVVLFFSYDWFIFGSANDCINFFINVEVLKMIQALELSAKMQIYASCEKRPSRQTGGKCGCLVGGSFFQL